MNHGKPADDGGFDVGDPQIDGVVRWRRIDLKEVIRDRFGVDYHERSVSRLLHTSSGFRT